MNCDCYLDNDFSLVVHTFKKCEIIFSKTMKLFKNILSQLNLPYILRYIT